MERTAIIPTISRKLSPFVILFGCYVISHGHLSPGGGFQGGVVLASGVLLLALGHSARRSKEPLGRRRPILPQAFRIAELMGLYGFIALALAGAVFAGGFLADPFPASWAKVRIITSGGEAHPWFVFLLNIAIGCKVGAGITLLCLTLLDEGEA